MKTAATASKPTLLAIAWPIFIEQTLRILIGTVDTFMVSHVSDGAVAALGIANQLVVLALICFNFIGIGASVVITHHVGANDRAGAEKIVTTAIAVNTWIGLAASLVAFLFAAPLLRLMQLPEDLMPYAQPFLTLMGGTLFMEAMNTAIGAALRAHGHTRDAMVVTVIQNVLNIALSCVLLFGLFGAPRMGVTGVALASVASRVVASIIFWVLLDRRLKLMLRAGDFFHLQLARIKRILHIGLPAAGEHMSYWVSLMVITSFAARLGGESLATMTYTQNVQRLVILFSIALGLGTEILIGRLIGAGDFDEAYRQVLKSIRTGLLISTGGILLVAVFATPLLGLFSHDATIIAGGVLLLRMSVLYEPGRVFNIVGINALRATGDARFPVQIAACSQWLLSVPLCWLFGLKLGWGLPGIWGAMMFEEWLRGLIMYRRWKRRDWLKYAHRSRDQVSARTLPLIPEA
ncbi:MATE family efflux transporter [Opitutus sp. GAS368]|jgi:putative MATE family efflux protein|uniref:MATE family efflux transporter n=1 Tax=Opitutus sp. GAS368 TaxID=1882749 RepID=UPI00087AB47A|nr:MATE family efflux transporter [Opitutus sp. GAS368]SDS58078.1 putative efflux protein, MATE family [Opitutus sp. GAS368]